MKNSILTLLITCLVSSTGFAQIAQGGHPLSLGAKWGAPSYVQTPIPNRVALAAEDALNDQFKDQPFRFGVNYDVNYAPDNSGTITQTANGTIWRLGIYAPTANSINLLFSEFNLSDGAHVFLYTPDHSIIRGSFTEENNKDNYQLATDVVESDSLIIEFFVPNSASGVNNLRVGRITFGYRSLDQFRGYGDSGACNNNVNCPVGLPWDQQKRSVAIIVVGGSGACTGALVNNTLNDGTPYFLTADHCLGGSVANWVFRFNWESPGCTNFNTTLNQSVSGSTLRASNGGSDFALLELSATPPQSYGVYFAGWDKSGNTPSSQVAIHHPSGDIKKISFDNDAAGTALWGGAQCWRIFTWEDGTTEPGSSGSPLFDQNHRIIGQLYGGTASCFNNIDDYYGRFDVSWDGTSASNRLRDWLDPNNNAPDTLDGFDPNIATLAIDCGTSNLIGVSSVICSGTFTPEAVINNYGIDTITTATISYQLNSSAWISQPWTGSLATYDSDTIVLPMQTAVSGSNTFTIAVSAPNGGPDGNPLNDTLITNFTAFPNGQMVTIEIQTDLYPGETTWEIADSNGVVVYTGGPYSNANSNNQEVVCLGDGCYDFTIFDSYGDGICCQFGNGFVNILDMGGTVIASNNGQFTTQATEPFCLGACTGLGAQSTTTNPSCFDAQDGSITLSGTGGSGSYSFSWNTGDTTSSVTGLGGGTYTCTVTSDGCDVIITETLSNPNPVVPTVTQSGLTLTTISGIGYQWFLSGSPIGGATSQSLTVTQNGTYTVEVTTANNCLGISAPFLVEGISWESIQLSSLNLFPQPSAGNVALAWSAQDSETYMARVVSITGQQVWSNTFEGSTGNNTWELNLNGLAAGTYLLQIQGEGGQTTLPLIIQ